MKGQKANEECDSCNNHGGYRHNAYHDAAGLMTRDGSMLPLKLYCYQRKSGTGDNFPLAIVYTLLYYVS